MFMAIELVTQQDLRPLQKLPFCYICGRHFSEGEVSNKDHVPPSALFLPNDRDFPLILPTHYDCNHERHLDDQTIGQLIGILHSKAPDPAHRRLDLYAGIGTDGRPIIAAGGFDLRDIIRRWVRGFHAALYGQPLTGEQFMTFPPLAEGNPDTGQIDPVHQIIPDFVRAIRHNRRTGALDRIVCRKGKCVYECVWLRDDEGRWFCCYAIDLYSWSRLGDVDRFGLRGCVGAYVPPERDLPSTTAARGERPDDTPLSEPLNPFADDTSGP
jgi:hypothetical protein